MVSAEMSRIEDPAVKEYVKAIKRQGMRCPHCGKWVIKPETIEKPRYIFPKGSAVVDTEYYG